MTAGEVEAKLTNRLCCVWPAYVTAKLFCFVLGVLLLLLLLLSLFLVWFGFWSFEIGLALAVLKLTPWTRLALN